jgi:hypothetical protein
LYKTPAALRSVAISDAGAPPEPALPQPVFSPPAAPRRTSARATNSPRALDPLDSVSATISVGPSIAAMKTARAVAARQRAFAQTGSWPRKRANRSTPTAAATAASVYRPDRERQTASARVEAALALSTHFRSARGRRKSHSRGAALRAALSQSARSLDSPSHRDALIHDRDRTLSARANAYSSFSLQCGQYRVSRGLWVGAAAVKANLLR